MVLDNGKKTDTHKHSLLDLCMAAERSIAVTYRKNHNWVWIAKKEMVLHYKLGPMIV